MKLFNFVIPVIAVSTLAACGGTTVPMTLEDIGERGLALAETVESIPYTDLGGGLN